MLDGMDSTTRERAARARPGPGGAPWFRRHPVLTLCVAVVLFAMVLCVRLLTDSPAEAYSMLYVFPVALLATAFGRRAGVAAGLAATGLVVVWVVTKDVSMSPSGWATRAVPLLLLGALVGDASDRLLRAEKERLELESAALLHREAIEINDSLVQGMVAARWLLESGQPDVGLAALDETIARGQRLVSALIREAGMGDRAEQVTERDHAHGDVA